MARVKETKGLAQAIQRHAGGAVKAKGLRVFEGIIRTVSPLSVELTMNDVVLGESDLLLGAWPRLYDKVWRLAVNDSLILFPLESGDWYVSDVLSKSNLDGGFDQTREAPLSRSLTFGTVVGTVPFFDATGDEIGVGLLFDPGSL